MTIRPKVNQDLMLAPVAAEIDHNLQRIRDRSGADLEYALELELNAHVKRESPWERAELVLRFALRDVDLHGWTATVSEDYNRIHLDGGSVSIDLGLGADVTAFILSGARTEPVSVI